MMQVFSHYQSKLPHSLRSIVTAAALRALLASALLYALAFTYCSQAFWRDPHSAFFKSDHVYEPEYSSIRQAEGLALVSAANYTRHQDGTPVPVLAGSHPTLCAAFVTVKRGEQEYLDAAIGSMLAGLTHEERENLYVSLLFSDTDPKVHPNWGHPWVRRLADEVDGYSHVSEDRIEEILRAEKAKNYYVKGVFDYIYVLERCMATTAPYISVFEDDIIFADGWMTKTLTALADLKRRSLPPPTPISAKTKTAVSSQQHRWLYLRLFYTETPLTMWTSTDFWYANIWLAFLLAMATGLLSLLVLRRYWAPARPHLDNGAVAVLTLITIPAFTALLFMVGKFNLCSPPYGSVFPMNENGCCTQALVFPRTEVPGLIRYLKERHDGQTDSLIEEYCDRDGLQRYALWPYVAQHVGLLSSRGNTAVNTQSNWAFWFETFRRDKMRKEHLRDVQKIPWEFLKSN